MTNTPNTSAPDVTFAQFLINKDSDDDNFGNFHSAMGDHGITFPTSATDFLEAISMGASSDGEVQLNAEQLAHIMREIGDYILMALVEYQNKEWTRAA